MNIKKLYELYRQHPVVTTDSRDCPEGSIFIALKGASFDGNKFAAMALEKGCHYAVVDEKEYCVEGDERYILVDDCLTTFKDWHVSTADSSTSLSWESREPTARPRQRSSSRPCSPRNTT